MPEETPSRDTMLALIAEEARIDPARLEPAATLASLHIESLDVVSILFAIEDRFGVEIAVEDLGEAQTLEQFVDVVMARVAPA